MESAQKGLLGGLDGDLLWASAIVWRNRPTELDDGDMSTDQTSVHPNCISSQRGHIPLNLSVISLCLCPTFKLPLLSCACQSSCRHRRHVNSTCSGAQLLCSDSDQEITESLLQINCLPREKNPWSSKQKCQGNFVFVFPQGLVFTNHIEIYNTYYVTALRYTLVMQGWALEGACSL